MKTHPRLLLLAALSASAFAFGACASPGVQDARMSGVERRQDRIDARTSARQARWKERAEREDARAEARFNSW